MPDPIRISVSAHNHQSYEFVAKPEPKGQWDDPNTIDVGNVVTQTPLQPSGRQHSMAGDEEILSGGGGGEVVVFNVLDECDKLLAANPPRDDQTNSGMAFETTYSFGNGATAHIRIVDDGLTLGNNPTDTGRRYRSNGDEITVTFTGNIYGTPTTQTLAFNPDTRGFDLKKQ